MGSGGSPGGSHEPDRLPAGHLFARLHDDPTQPLDAPRRVFVPSQAARSVYGYKIEASGGTKAFTKLPGMPLEVANFAGNLPPGGATMDAAAASSLDLSQLEEIGLHLADTAEGLSPESAEVTQLAAAPPELEPTIALEAEDDSTLLAIEPEAGVAPAAAPPAAIDLDQLGGIEFALGDEEPEAEAAPAVDTTLAVPIDLDQLDEIAIEPADVSQGLPPPAAAPLEGEPILELESETDRQPFAGESAAETPAGDTQEVTEYVIEIEDKLEIEVDELKLEVEDDDANR